MKSAKSKRQLTILTLILALGVAVYLNWEYAKTDSSFVLPTQTQAEGTPCWQTHRRRTPL